MRAFVTTVFVTSFSVLASCQTAGIKGTIIVRQHCGTPIGAPSLWIDPSYYVSNATAHHPIQSTWSCQRGGNPQGSAGTPQANNVSRSSTTTRPGNTASATTNSPNPSSTTHTPGVSQTRSALSGSGISSTAGPPGGSSQSPQTSIPSNQPSRSSNSVGQSPQTPNSGNLPPTRTNGIHTALSTSALGSATIMQSPCITATAAPINCPGSNGSVYTPAGSCIGGEDSYIIDCGIEYSGGGLTTLAGVTDIETCIGSCNDDTYCVAVAYDSANNMCYERSSVVFGNTTATPNLIFAFNARYVNAGGVYPSPGVEAVPSGLTKTLLSITSKSNFAGSGTTARATVSTELQGTSPLNPGPPGASTAAVEQSPQSTGSMPVISGQSSGQNSVGWDPSISGLSLSSGSPVVSTGSASVVNQPTSPFPTQNQAVTLVISASQGGSLSASAATITGPASSTPTVPVSQACPQDADLITVPEGSTWYVNCAQLYIGELVDVGINATSSLSADDCLAMCDGLGSGCVGFTYTDSTCMLYSRIDGVRNAAVNIVSARRFVQGAFSSALTTFSASTESVALASQVSTQAQPDGGGNPSLTSGGETSSLQTSNGSNSVSTLSAPVNRQSQTATSSLLITGTIPNSQGTTNTASVLNSSPTIGVSSGSSLSLTGGSPGASTASPPSPTTTRPSLATSGSVLGGSTALQSSPSFNSPLSNSLQTTTPLPRSTTTISGSSTVQSSEAVVATQAAPCPSADRQTYTDQSGTQYMILCSTDTYPGNFAAEVGISFDSCVENCARQTEQSCVAVTYSNNTCFYKAQYERNYPVGNVQAAVRLNLVTGTRSTALAASTSMSLGAGSSLAALSSSLSLGSTLSGATSHDLTPSVSASSSLAPTGTSLNSLQTTSLANSAISATSSTSLNSLSSLTGGLLLTQSGTGTAGSTLGSGGSASAGHIFSSGSISSSGLSVNTAAASLSAGAVTGSIRSTSSSANSSPTPSGHSSTSSHATATSALGNTMVSSSSSSSGLGVTPQLSLSNVVSSNTSPTSQSSTLSAGSSSSQGITNGVGGTSSPSLVSSHSSWISVSGSIPSISIAQTVTSSATGTQNSVSNILSSSNMGLSSASSNLLGGVSSTFSGLASSTSLSNSPTPTPTTLPNTIPATSLQSTIFSSSTPALSSVTLSTSSVDTANLTTTNPGSSVASAVSNSINPSISTSSGQSSSTILATSTAQTTTAFESATSTLTVAGSAGGSLTASSSSLLGSGLNSGPLSSTSAPVSATTASPSSQSSSSPSSTSQTQSASLNGGSASAPTFSSSMETTSTGSAADSLSTNPTSSAGGGSGPVSMATTSTTALGGVSSSSVVSPTTETPSSGLAASSPSLSTTSNLPVTITESIHPTTSSMSLAGSVTSSTNSPLSFSSFQSSVSSSQFSVSFSSISTTTTASSSASVSTLSSTSRSSSSSVNSGTTTTLSTSSSTRTTCAPIPTAPTCPSGNGTIYQALDGSYFRLDCGIDYPGLTVDAYAAVDIDTCFQICDARGSTCAGVSYVPNFLTSLLSGYTCYIKSSVNAAGAVRQTYETNSLVRLSIGSTFATGTAPVCPAANNQVYVTADGSRFRIKCNTDYPNNGLIQANASSLQVCIDACDRAGILCAGASYTPAGNDGSSQPVCYLKSAIGTGVNAVLGLVGGMLGAKDYDVHSAVRIGNPTLINPPAYSCSPG